MSTKYLRKALLCSMSELEVQNYLAGKVSSAIKDGRKVIRVSSVVTDGKMRETKRVEQVIVGGFFK